MPNATKEMEDVYKKKATHLIIGGACTIILLIFLFGSFYVVSAGERAILITFGSPSAEARTEGLHMKIPMVQNVHVVDIKTQVASFDNEKGKGDVTEQSSLFAASKDLQDVQIATVVNYHVEPAKVVEIYKTFGKQPFYEANIIEPIIRETVKATASKYTAEELVTKRLEFQTEVERSLSEKLAPKYAMLEKVNIVNFEFSPSFTQAIEAKVTAEQNALAAKNKLEQVKFEAEQRIASAQGEAEALRLQKEQVSPELIALRQVQVQQSAIDKWNGILPQVTGNAIPFISLGQNPMQTQSIAGGAVIT